MDLYRDIENEISQIRSELSSHICDSELAEFYQLLTKLKCNAVKCGLEKMNSHYIICPWSNQSCMCGPDSCICISVYSSFNQIKKYILLFRRKLSNKIILS